MASKKQGEHWGGAPYRAVREWLRDKRQQDAARLLGVSQQSVSLLALGKLVPGPLLKVRLEKLAHIGANTWPETRRSERYTRSEINALARLANVKRARKGRAA